MDAKIVTIIHAQKGEIEVKENFAKIALKHNHVSKGGSYCSLDEAYLYFKEYAPKKEEEEKPAPKKRGRRKKATTTTPETAAKENQE